MRWLSRLVVIARCDQRVRTHFSSCLIWLYNLYSARSSYKSEYSLQSRSYCRSSIHTHRAPSSLRSPRRQRQHRSLLSSNRSIMKCVSCYLLFYPLPDCQTNCLLTYDVRRQFQSPPWLSFYHSTSGGTMPPVCLLQHSIPRDFPAGTHTNSASANKIRRVPRPRCKCCCTNVRNVHDAQQYMTCSPITDSPPRLCKYAAHISRLRRIDKVPRSSACTR